MPIRFRCRYCNQLLGIARRKAGSPVRCPSCRKEVVVPAHDNLEPWQSAPAPAPQPAAAPLFERSDFEDLFGAPALRQSAPAPEPPRPVPAQVLPPGPGLPLFDADPVAAPGPSVGVAENPRPVGILLSPTQATLLTVVAILLLALAFGAGLFVGHYWLG